MENRINFKLKDYRFDKNVKMVLENYDVNVEKDIEKSIKKDSNFYKFVKTLKNLNDNYFNFDLISIENIIPKVKSNIVLRAFVYAGIARRYIAEHNDSYEVSEALLECGFDPTFFKDHPYSGIRDLAIKQLIRNYKLFNFTNTDEIPEGDFVRNEAEIAVALLDTESLLNYNNIYLFLMAGANGHFLTDKDGNLDINEYERRMGKKFDYENFDHLQLIGLAIKHGFLVKNSKI